MANVSFSHELYEIDAAVDGLAAMQQRFGIAAIVPCTAAQYDAITDKSPTTLYIVYGADNFTMYFGTLPLPSGGGGAGAGIMMLSPAGVGGAAGVMATPEVV